MTTSEVKEYFKEIRREQSEVEHLAGMIRREELNFLPKAIVYDRERVQTSPDDILANKAAEIEEMERELRKSVVILMGKRARAEAKIIQLDNHAEREVMRYYYLDSLNGRLLSWDDVAQVMELSTASVFRIHGNALKNLSRVM